MQSNLRDALRGIQDQVESGGQDSQELDQETTTNHILKCTYLDWVVRECLRLHAPVTNTMRVCMRDYDEIPLLNPINHHHGDSERTRVSPGEAMDSSASHLGHKYENQGPAALGLNNHRPGLGSRNTTTIPIRKWDIVSVPIQAVNKSEMFWGEDAAVFRYGFLSLLICSFLFFSCPWTIFFCMFPFWRLVRCGEFSIRWSAGHLELFLGLHHGFRVLKITPNQL